ncbi:MAG: hypothetical protein Q9162_001287 [Coniocarpon cinnabarinum]
MPVSWTSENKFKLLLAVMQVKNPDPPDWNQVTSLLGNGVTVEGCRQQYKAIRKTAGKDLALNGTAVTPSTPRKRKANGNANGDTGAEGEEELPASKSPKKGHTPKKPAPKDVKTGDENEQATRVKKEMNDEDAF